MANQQRGAFYGSVEEYVKARGGNRPIKKVSSACFMVAGYTLGPVAWLRLGCCVCVR